MKKLLTILFSVTTLLIFAQNTISGTITDNEGNTVSSASVTIEDPTANPAKIIAFAITNSKGNYKITYNSALSNVRVKVKAFNQEPQSKVVKNDTQTINFKVSSTVTEIKEVVLKSKIITSRGDTISYDLKPFANPNDRTLADVLKKMPGIDVNSDGTILYQGNPINKFYVNGKDLMEGSYGTINKSLPIDAIAQVQVLENHQPIKILQDKVPSDQAALNVKLKKKVTMTGRAELGVGASPALWNVKLTPMVFTDKTQWLLNFKANNNGDAVQNDLNVLAFGSRYEGITRNIGQTSWLNVNQASTPPISQNRYLKNNVQLFSGNILTNLDKNKQWEFKANGSYVHNIVSKESFTETDYLPAFNNGDVISSAIKNRLYTNQLKGQMVFTKNAKKGYFKNTTTFTQFWNSGLANAIRTINGATDPSNTARQNINSPTSSFQNSLSTIIPWKEKLINVRSFINIQNDAQTLLVNPFSYTPQDIQNGNTKEPIYSDPLTKYAVQDYRMNTVETVDALNMSFSAGKWTFTPEAGINYVMNHLYSDLSGRDDSGVTEQLDDRFMNAVKFSNKTPYFSGQINYRGTHLMLYVTIPFNFHNINATDPNPSRNVNVQLNKSTIEPNLFAQYQFASFWKASVNGNLSNSFGTISSVYAGYILQSPTSLNLPFSNGTLSQSRSRSGSAAIDYRNPLNNLFFNVRSSISKSTNNLMLNTFLENGNSTSEFIVRDNDVKSNSQSAQIGKYFPGFKTNASFNFSNSHSTSESMNNNIIQTTEGNNKSTSFKFNNAFFSWMSLDYTLSYGWGKNSYNYSGSTTTNKSNNLSNNMNLIFYPIKNNSIGLNWDQSNFKQGDKSFHNPFYDITYQYTWAKRKMDFEIKWLNIANTKVYQTISNSSVGTTYQRMFIRPSQVMFTVKFNF